VPIATESRVVIVGAGAGGLTAAEALRNEGFTGPITLIGHEPHVPYHRPPLSKQVLTGEWTADRTHLLDATGLARLDLHLALGTRATALDITGRTVTAGGELIPYDRLIIATGVMARGLAGVRRLAGMHTLRTIDDAIALRADLEAARRVVVIGSGVLGSEIASAARKLGREVVLIGRSRAMRLGQVGDHLSAQIEQLHRDNGVAVRSGVTVTDAIGGPRVEGVALSDGSVVPADVVVVAVGGAPSTDWLAGSGLDIRDGVACDATGQAARDVYAVGDVARWCDEAGDAVPRAEHHLNAVEQALAVAHLLMTGKPSRAIIPFFWSELHGTRIQAYGRFASAVPLETIAGDPADHRFVAASRREGRITGVVGWNMPRDFRDARTLVDQSPAVTQEGVPS